MIRYISQSGLAWRIHCGLEGWQANAVAIAVPLLIGLAKEATDKNFNFSDIIGYGAGASSVVLFTF
jgi:hypothetical protein